MKSNRPFLPRALCSAILLTALTLLIVWPARGDSLYRPGVTRGMFSDRRARGVGDVLTIQITETTLASQDATSEASRKANSRADGGTGLWGILDHVPSATLSGTTEHKGSGSTTRSSRLITTMSCRVVEITPNGQLVVSGERSVRVNDDTQTIRFHGIVRPEDVNLDNIVPSSLVADARIEVVGKGPINRHVKPGILSRIFQFLF
jgi:flagellar L-ring protein precursor FlgH